MCKFPFERFTSCKPNLFGKKQVRSFIRNDIFYHGSAKVETNPETVVNYITVSHIMGFHVIYTLGVMDIRCMVRARRSSTCMSFRTQDPSDMLERRRSCRAHQIKLNAPDIITFTNSARAHTLFSHSNSEMNVEFAWFIFSSRPAHETRRSEQKKSEVFSTQT